MLNRCGLNSLISVYLNKWMEYIWILFAEFDIEAANNCLLFFLVVGDDEREFVKETFLTVVAINDELIDKCHANNCTDIKHETVNFPHFIEIVLHSKVISLCQEILNWLWHNIILILK